MDAGLTTADDLLAARGSPETSARLGSSHTGVESGRRCRWRGGGLQRQPLFLAGEPLQDHDARVVLELVGLVVENAAHQPPHGLWRRILGGGGGADEVGQPPLTEELAVGRAGLGDAVGHPPVLQVAGDD